MNVALWHLYLGLFSITAMNSIHVTWFSWSWVIGSCRLICAFTAFLWPNGCYFLFVNMRPASIKELAFYICFHQKECKLMLWNLFHYDSFTMKLGRIVCTAWKSRTWLRYANYWAIESANLTTTQIAPWSACVISFVCHNCPLDIKSR